MHAKNAPTYIVSASGVPRSASMEIIEELSPISNEMILCALHDYARESSTSSKLSWWVLSGRPSAERWFQFDFSYHLHRRIVNRHYTTCERTCNGNPIDIAILRTVDH